MRRLFALLTLAVAQAGVAPAKPAHRQVIVPGEDRFFPFAVTIRSGESVTWVNKDPFPHTVTAAGKFDSKEIAANGKWTYRATKPGEYAYICTLHPNMKGTLKVE